VQQPLHPWAGQQRRPCIDVDANQVVYTQLHLASGPAAGTFDVGRGIGISGADINYVTSFGTPITLRHIGFTILGILVEGLVYLAAVYRLLMYRIYSPTVVAVVVVSSRRSICCLGWWLVCLLRLHAHVATAAAVGVVLLALIEGMHVTLSETGWRR
jgi:hypothetical protein